MNCHFKQSNMLPATGGKMRTHKPLMREPLHKVKTAIEEKAPNDGMLAMVGLSLTMVNGRLDPLHLFAKSCLDEKLSTWIKLNINALEYLGCCPKAMVPDNLKSAVSKASRYEPDMCSDTGTNISLREIRRRQRA